MKRTWKACIGLGVASALFIPVAGSVLPRTVSAAETGDVKIDEKHFPDKEFRNYVKQFDQDKNGTFSKKELEDVKEIVCDGIPVQSMEGIEYFTELQKLSGDSTLYHQINLSANTKLAMLLWGEGQLVDLDLSANTELEYLYVCNCGLSKLDLSKNTKLQNLYCGNNALGELDLSQNTELVDLACEACLLTKLDLSKNLKLTCINCMSNSITELDLSNHKDLEMLYVRDCPITKINISGCTKLQELECSQTKLSKAIDTSICPDLESLSYDGTDITSIDVSHNTKLNSLYCYGSKVSELDLTKNTELEILSIGNCPISSIDLSANKKLTELDISDTKIEKMDFAPLTNLRKLYMGRTKLKTIDLNLLPNIEDLYCNDTGLESLDLHNCKNLMVLDCAVNQIRELDLQNCSRLYRLDCAFNELEELDLSQNPTLVQLTAENNNIKKLVLSDSFNEGRGTKYVDLRMNRLTEKPDLPSDVTYLFFPQKQDLNIIGLKMVERNKNTVTLKWLPPKAFDENEYRTNFEIWRASSESGPFEKLGETYVTYFEDKNTRESVSYFYKVRMVYDFSQDGYPFLAYGDFSEVLSTEKVDASFEDFVERLYSVALDRASDPEGKAFWIKQVVDEGKTGADCARFFLLDAPEFMNRNLPVEDFVETLYETFFDRESDEAGKKGWVEAISSGKKSRAEVVNDFIESTEWCNVCATYGVKSGAQWHKATQASKNATNFATRLYTCCLKREAEEGGLQYWALALTNLEKTGAQAAQFFFEGEEFVGFNTSDIEYLTRLYTTFMDREPSVEELNFWVGEMKAGKQTRKSILVFFAQSPEFTSICKKYGIERGEIG